MFLSATAINRLARAAAEQAVSTYERDEGTALADAPMTEVHDYCRDAAHDVLDEMYRLADDDDFIEWDMGVTDFIDDSLETVTESAITYVNP